MGRAPCCDKANVKKGPWSPEEDETLKVYIDQFGTGGNWISLPQKIGLKRCGKSCRLRWLNYLRPNLKHGGFSEEEDNIICSLYISIGSRWSIIAAQLPGRTDNGIKNYWNTRLKKKLLGRRKQSNKSSGTSQDPKDSNGLENLSSAAMERLHIDQLQGFESPFSFNTNPALWHKLNPFQEKMIYQSHQILNDNSDQYNPLMHDFLPSPPPGDAQIFEQYQTYVIPESDGGKQPKHTEFHPISTLQSEMDEFLMNTNKMSDLDRFNELDNSKVIETWWSNGLDTNSVSSNSWDSTYVQHHDQSEIEHHKYYTNLGLWPNLNPHQEKMIQQRLQLLNNGPHTISIPLIKSPQPEEGLKVELYQPSSTLQQDYSSLLDENSMNDIPSPDSSIPFNGEIDIPESSIIPQTSLGFSPVTTFQAELDDFLANNKQTVQFDCFKEMDGSKNKEIWWSDEFDTNSASSNSWYSTSFLHHDQSGVGCHDFVQGYSIQ